MPRPARTAASSARVVVVPTATTRRLSFFARLIALPRLADRKALGVERVGLDLVDADRLKRAVSDVQRDRGALDAPRVEGQQNLGREMKTRRWRRDRPALARVDRLISLPIGRVIIALDVGRQRHVTDRVHRLVDAGVVVGPETDGAPPVEMPLENLPVQRLPVARGK